MSYKNTRSAVKGLLQQETSRMHQYDTFVEPEVSLLPYEYESYPQEEPYLSEKSSNWQTDYLSDMGDLGGEKSVKDVSQLGQAIAKEKLQVNLSNKMDGLATGEGKWMPEMEMAEMYLENLSILNDPNSHSNEELINANTVVQQLEPQLKEIAKVNPYMQDIFYDDSMTGNGLIGLKSLANEFTNKRIFNFGIVTPWNSVSRAIEDNALSEDDFNRLWDNKLNKSPEERLKLLRERYDQASLEYQNKTEDIIKVQNALKKGNWYFDPTMLTPEFEKKVEDTQLSLTNPESWFYNLTHLGSSLSEAEMMLAQFGTSMAAKQAAKMIPYLGQTIAVTEAIANLGLAKYYRTQETASEIFDNFKSNIQEQIMSRKKDVSGVINDWRSKLNDLGYNGDLLLDSEVFDAGLAQGLSIDDPELEGIRQSAYERLEAVRTVNQALSYVDYLQSLPMSYSGKILWNKAKTALNTKGSKIAKEYTHELVNNTVTKELDNIVDKAIIKGVTKLANKPATKALVAETTKDIRRFATTIGLNIGAETLEEGQQYGVGYFYKNKYYHDMTDAQMSPIWAAGEAGRLGAIAALSYLGWDPTGNSLNTDENLINAMEIGGFIGAIMPVAHNASATKRTFDRYLNNNRLRQFVEKGYDNAEQDTKMDVFLEGISQNSDNYSYTYDYLDRLRQYKGENVTDQMITEDQEMLDDLYAYYNNKNIKSNLEHLGITRGSDEHRKVVKNFIHLNDITKHAQLDKNNATSILYEALEQMENNPTVEFTSQVDQIFNQYVEKRKNEDKDYQERLNAVKKRKDKEKVTKEFEEQLGQQRQSFEKALLQQAILNYRTKVLKKLIENVKQRNDIFDTLAKEHGVSTDTSIFVDVESRLNELLKQTEKQSKDFSETYGIVENPEAIQHSTLDRMEMPFISMFINSAVSDAYTSKRDAYLTGKFDGSREAIIGKISYSDLSENQRNNLREQYIKAQDLDPDHKVDPTKIEEWFNTRIANEEITDQNRILADILIQRDLNRSTQETETARSEKIESGEIVSDETEPEPTVRLEEQSEQPDQSLEQPLEPQVKPIIDEKPERIPVEEGRTQDQGGYIDQILDDYDKQEERVIITQEGKEVVVSEEFSAEPEQTGAEKIEDVEVETEIAPLHDNVEVTSSPVAEPETESLHDNVQTTDEPSTQESVVVSSDQVGDIHNDVVEVTEDKSSIETVEETTVPSEAKPDNTPVPPSPQQVQIEKEKVEEIQDIGVDLVLIDGELYADNGTRHIEEQFLLQEEEFIEDVNPEIYGESFAMTHMVPVLNEKDNDRVGNQSSQLVFHVSNTFFYQPDAVDPMNITVNGKPVKWKTQKTLKSGKDLAKALLDPNWISTTTKYFIVTNHQRGSEDIYDQAIHLVIEDENNRYICSLRTPEYVSSLIRGELYSQKLNKQLVFNNTQKSQLEQQRQQLITLRTQIVNAYLGNSKTIPVEIRTHVAPSRINISNGPFNSQKDVAGNPIRQSLMGVTELGIPDDVVAIDQMIKNEDIEIGYGTGAVEQTVRTGEEFVIRKLGSDTELTDTQGKGRSGALYLIPKSSQTPNGSVAPIQLSVARLDSTISIDPEQVEFSEMDQHPKSFAEAVFRMLTGQYQPLGELGTQQLLEMIVNHGMGTVVSDEVAAKYPFLMDKMLFYNKDRESGEPYLEFAIRQNKRVYKRYVIPKKNINTPAVRKMIISHIANHFHWNTDKNALLESIPPAIVNALKGYFKQNPDKQSVSIGGFEQLTFTREDLGLTETNKTPVSVLAWMIKTGKVQTDLGNTIYSAPYVYAEGVQTNGTVETKKEPQNKPKEVVKPVEQTSTQVTPEATPDVDGIEHVSTNEGWTREKINEKVKELDPFARLDVYDYEIVRVDGELMPIALPKRVVTSFVRGEGQVDIQKARKWLHDVLGIDEADVLTSTAAFKVAGYPDKAYGAVKIFLNALSNPEAKIILSEEAGKGIEYHEAFHYVSLLLIPKSLRIAIYEDWRKANPDQAYLSNKEVEEKLAEEFRAYVLNKERPWYSFKKLRYQINKVFRTIYNFIRYNNAGRLTDNLFKKIRKGDFKQYKPTKDELIEFDKEFGGVVYMYIPGVSEKELQNMASITDPSTFYSVVDSLNSIIMSRFRITNKNDISKIGQNIDKLFKELYVNNLMHRYGDNEQLIKDVIANKEVFKKQIDQFLRTLSIVKKNTEDAQKNRDDKLEDKPENTWDIESYEINKKDNVALRAKLFFYSIPKNTYAFTETGKILEPVLDSVFGMQVSEDFDVVWNKILENLWDVDSYADLIDTCLSLSADPFFRTLYDKLTSTVEPVDEQQATQILNTIKSAKNQLLTIQAERKEGARNVTDNITWTINDADIYRIQSRLPSAWSMQFFLSGLIKVGNKGTRSIDFKKFSQYVRGIEALIDATRKDKKIGDEERFAKIKNLFVTLAGNMSISVDELAFDELLKLYGAGPSKTNLVAFDSMWKAFKDVIKNMNQMATSGQSEIKNSQGATIRSLDRIYNKKDSDYVINRIAVAWVKIHPSPTYFSVTGANGNLVYPISENNYVSDQIRWLKKNKNGKRELFAKNSYSKNSILLRQIQADESKVQVNTFLNFRENLTNSNRDYFGISQIEDYLSKMTFGFRNMIFCPTMSDKKTFHTISGINMVKDYIHLTMLDIENSTFDEMGAITNKKYIAADRRFSQNTIEVFKGYFIDEFAAIKKYFAAKQKVIDNPNLHVDNYFGTKKNNYLDGNGGRFRYFNKITINGENFNLNEMLAKAEASGNWNTVLKQIDGFLHLENNLFDDAINSMLIDFADNEWKKVKKLGIIYEGGHWLPSNVYSEFHEIGQKSGIESENSYLDTLYSIVASHALNSAISVIEIEKLFTGDPALYKWQKEALVFKPGDDSYTPVPCVDERGKSISLDEWLKLNNLQDKASEYNIYFKITGRDVDKIKRLSSVLSTGTNLRTNWNKTKNQDDPRNDDSFTVMQLKDSEIGSTQYDRLYELFRTSLIKDMYQKEFNLDDTAALNAVSTKEKAEEAYEKLSKESKSFVDKQSTASTSPYAEGQINQADAAVYIRPEFYKRIAQALGQWNDEIEEAYNILETNDDWLSDPDLYQKAIKFIHQPLKMVYFGDHFDNDLQMNVNTFDKMALFPLFKSFAKADNKKLYDRMNNKEKGVIDMVAFESAIKVGGRNKLNYYQQDTVTQDLDKVSSLNNDNHDGLPVYRQSLSQIRLQLNTDPHEHLERALGTQASKIGFANVVDTREYGSNKGLKIRGYEIKKNIIESINALTDLGVEEVYKRLYEGGHVSKKKLVNYLRKEAARSGMSQEMISGFTVDKDGDIIVPLESMSIRSWVQTKLVSFINKVCVDINTPGGTAIQMSSFGYELKDKSISTDKDAMPFNNGKKLKFLKKKGHMEVILSENFFKDILPENLKDASFKAKRDWLMSKGIIGNDATPYGIGYRIPTQGLSSMFSFTVADIMPTTIGDTIIVPEEFTAMTGSDFDVDKLYIATYAYRDGSRVDSNEVSKEGWVNKLLDNYSYVLTDFSNIAETRASIDTLTSIMKKEIVSYVSPRTTEEASPMYELSPYFQLLRKTEYTGGKMGIAPFALNTTNHALTQYSHLSIDYANGNRYNLGALDEIYGQDGQRILDWLSALINAHVDVAKDPYIMALNVNSKTYNLTSLLIRGGKGDSTFYFLAQPILVRLMNDLLKQDGVIGVKESKTEPQLIKEAYTKTADRLRKQIEELPEGTDKDEWIAKYNGLANVINQAKIITQIEDKAPVYTDVFNKDLCKNALEDRYSIQGTFHQLLTLKAYADLSKEAKVLGELVQLSRIDTKGYGNNIADQANFTNRLNKFINKQQKKFYITNNPEIKQPLTYYLSSTFLQSKLDAATKLPIELLESQMLEATTGYRPLFNFVCEELFGDILSSDKVNAVNKIVSNVIRSMAVKNFAPKFDISDTERKRMMGGAESTAKRLLAFKNKLKQRTDIPGIVKNGVIVNDFLNYLQEYSADNSTNLVDKIITASSIMDITPTTEEKLISSFAELLNHDDVEIKEMAEELALYAYITSYDNRGNDTFFDLVPLSWRIRSGYCDAIKNIINAFNNSTLNGLSSLGFDIMKLEEGNYTDFLVSIIRNGANDENIVSSMKNPHKIKSIFIFDFIEKGKVFNAIPSVFTISTNSRDNQAFVKRPVTAGAHTKILLYQRVGTVEVVDKDGNAIPKYSRSVYKLITPLGLHDGRKHYYEYDKSPYEESAFRANAVPKNADISEKDIKTELNKLYMASSAVKEGDFVYTTTDAIVVKYNIMESTQKKDVTVVEDMSSSTLSIEDNSSVNTEIVDHSSGTINITDDFVAPLEISDIAVDMPIIDPSVDIAAAMTIIEDISSQTSETMDIMPEEFNQEYRDICTGKK